MQKNRSTILFILLLLGSYFLFSQFHLKMLGNRFTYLINPIFFLLIALIVMFTVSSQYRSSKYKKSIIQYVIVASLSYSVLLLVSGLFLTYGNNPYSTTFKGLMLNLYSIGLVVVCTEYIRYKLINIAPKRDKNLIFIFIVIVFTLKDVDIHTLKNSLNIYYLFKTIFSIIIPSIIKNCLFTYLAEYTDCIPAIIYELILYLIQWLAPVLPKTPWIFMSIIDSIFPLILLLYCRYEIKSKDISSVYKLTEPVEPKGTIPLIMGFVIIIWFALGIFPIRPIGIATGSMIPSINVGDLIIIKKCSANDIKLNDVIEYTKNNYSVIHRVIEIYQKDGKFFFVTKGDNNDSKDSEPVGEDQLKGKAIARIPYLAMPTIWLNSLSGEQEEIEAEINN